MNSEKLKHTSESSSLSGKLDGVPSVVIIDYGAGNIKSIQFAFKRLGVDALLSNDPETIRNADRVIFPGVGEASSALKMLKSTKLDKLIPTLTQPVLGICLGMQLLCKTTEEGNTKGLGIFQVDVKRFPNTVKVPQMGWNTITDLKSYLFKDIPENSYMYLVHSYYAENCKEAIALTNYNGEYATAVRHNNFYGVQFHPEKSSIAGAKLLENFLNLES
ncbi:imidazole glycerol phosphate synthase subunit HisH [Formosa sp. PL04]|uniref:imidazole glycerol phosphate synthase subunit HisH n=1 Tax=Formosa sp. PL04 TaxID=3081755 RepID=UPI0029827045|nr:imidazole glycerol phosphate synthase subunit HisH [Formosa sp. PL04]MDW5288424.1 imidazole glycerol phosphate synthase subunit HisH [Formosa sp. PL04]